MRKQVRQKDERGWFEVERQTGLGMKHFTIIELDKNFSIPENLSECTQEQYIDANRFIYAYQNGLIDENQFKSLMIISFLVINPIALREDMIDKALRSEER